MVIAATLAYRRQHVVLGGDGAVVGLTVLVAKRVAAEEVIQIPGFGAGLLPGAKGFHNGDVYRLNASYVPLQLFIQLGQELPEGPWQQVATQIPDILRGSSPNGFPSDWAEFYDAIRVYLWAGMLDPATRDRDAVLKALPGMARYLRANAIPPSQARWNRRERQESGWVFCCSAALSFSSRREKSREPTNVARTVGV